MTIMGSIPMHVISQTCCSGGVPLSGNIGFSGSDKGTLQMDLSYDINYLATLRNNENIYLGENRRRITQALLLKAGYSITDRIAIDGLISYVNQSRKITYVDNIDEVNTYGIGDAVIIGKFLLSRLDKNGIELQLGIGPKIPIGRHDITTNDGISLNADIQPGSGSWDLISWAYFIRQFKFRPSATFSVRVVSRLNGTNKKYFGNQSYHFGNSFQIYIGAGDQFLIGNALILPSISLRYRKALPDKVNEFELDNTGGDWINIIPAIGWQIFEYTILNIIPEIPIYSRVEGIQLTPTFRAQIGIYHTFKLKSDNEFKTIQL